MKPWRHLFLLILLTGSPAGAAAAADPPDPDLRTDGARKAGPFHYRPFFELRDLGYDDNVFYDTENPRGDATATIRSGVQAVVRAGEHAGLFLYRSLDYVTFRSFRDLNHWNGRSRARGSWWTEDFLLSLEEDFRTVERRPNSEIDRRLRRRNRVTGARLRTLSLGRLEMEVELRRERFDYPGDDPEARAAGRQLNRDENRIGLEGAIRIRPKTDLIVGTTYETVEFLERASTDNTRAVGFQTGLRFQPKSTLQGGFRIGPTSLEVPGRPDLDWDGLVGEGEVGTRLGSKGRVSGRFERNVTFSLTLENLYYIHQITSASYEHFLTRRASVAARYGRGSNDYPEEIDRGGPEPFRGFRKDRLLEAGIEFRYRWNDQMSWTAGVLRQERDSNDDINDIERNLITFGTRYEF